MSLDCRGFITTASQELRGLHASYMMRRSIYRLSSVGDRRVNEYLLPRLSSLRKIHIYMQIFVWGKTVRYMQAELIYHPAYLAN